MLNVVLIDGVLGTDPYVWKTRNGPIAKFKLGYRPPSFKRERKVRETDPNKIYWHNIVVFTPSLVRKVAFLRKKDYVVVSGMLFNDVWEDANGIIHKFTYIAAKEIFTGLPIWFIHNNFSRDPISPDVLGLDLVKKNTDKEEDNGE